MRPCRLCTVSSYWKVKRAAGECFRCVEGSWRGGEDGPLHADIKLVSAPTRSETGYRNDDESAVRKLVFVRRAREFGFSINECREPLSLYEDQQRSSADVKRIATGQLEEIVEKQRELQSLHDELAHLVDGCKGDERPACPIIDGLGKRHAER